MIRLTRWLQFVAWTVRRSYQTFLAEQRPPPRPGCAAGVRIVAGEHLDAAADVYFDVGVYLHCGRVAWCPGQGKIAIGSGTYVGPYSVLFGMGEIMIGRDVMISPHVTITSVEHPIDDVSRPMYAQPRIYRPVRIDDDVYIGSGAVVTPGVTIGRGAVIGAGAVVTRDVPPYGVALGVPARVVRSRDGTQGVDHAA